MITKNNLGINLGFANNRFPEPEAWTEIVDNELNLHNVQFVADILNPTLKKYNEKYFDEQIEKTIDCAKRHNINITSMMTSSFTRVNHFSHPDEGYRNAWFSWFVDFLKMGAMFGAKSAGSHFGIMTVTSLKNKNEIYKNTIKRWKELSLIAKNFGYEYLFFEPMSVEREYGNTIENTETILNDINNVSYIPFKLCLDVGHAPHPTQRDYKEWLEKFAKDSIIIHLQQTTLNSSNHSPFTDEYNTNGVVDPKFIINTLNKYNVSPELDFEISFREKEEIENTVIPDLKKSVLYWENEINDSQS